MTTKEEAKQLVYRLNGLTYNSSQAETNQTAMKIFLSVAFLFLSINGFGQTDSLQKSKPDSLWYRNPFFRLYPVVMNNDTRLYKGEAEALFSKQPEAFEHYKKYRNKFKVSLYSYAGIFVGISVGVLGMENNNRTLMGIGLTAGIYSFFNAIIFAALADAKLQKAIKTYNLQALRF